MEKDNDRWQDDCPVYDNKEETCWNLNEEEEKLDTC